MKKSQAMGLIYIPVQRNSGSVNTTGYEMILIITT